MLNTEHLSGNIFLNFFFGALVEIPAYIICILLLNRVGRKKMNIAFLITGGICDILTIFPTMYASDGKRKHLFSYYCCLTWLIPKVILDVCSMQVMIQKI